MGARKGEKVSLCCYVMSFFLWNLIFDESEINLVLYLLCFYRLLEEMNWNRFTFFFTADFSFSLGKFNGTGA